MATIRGHVQYRVPLSALKLPPVFSLRLHKATFCPSVLVRKETIWVQQVFPDV